MQSAISVQDLVSVSGSGATYLNLFNEYWYIVDQATLAGVFGENPQITSVSSLPAGAQMGPTIGPGSAIWQPQGSSNIFFVCTGKPITAYLITSETALSYYQFNGPTQTCNNQVISDWVLAMVSDGPNINMP